MSYQTAALENCFELVRDRFVAYYELCKPRVVTMILITALAGFYMGASPDFQVAVALRMLLGVALAAGGTLALNQYIERDTDAIMVRTRNRAIPAARVAPVEALTLGLLASAVGAAQLWLAVNPLSAVVTATITVLYLGAYTPMKRHSWICHMIGAVPGALPPVIGWAAARQSLSVEALVMFGIMFFWQLPHSLSIARLYQADYARAGLSLLPQDRKWGNPASFVMLAATITLTVFGTLPAWMGFAGRIYLMASVLLGGVLLVYTLGLVRGATTARRVMFVSLIYLPCVLLAMVLDKV